MTEDDTFRALRKPDLHHMEHILNEYWKTLIIEYNLNHISVIGIARREAEQKYWDLLNQHGWNKDEFTNAWHLRMLNGR